MPESHLIFSPRPMVILRRMAGSLWNGIAFHKPDEKHAGISRLAILRPQLPDMSGSPTNL